MKNKFLEIAQLEEVAQQSLSLAKARGASEAEVMASMDDGFSVNVRMGEVETVEYHQDKGIGITVYFGKRSGSVTTTDTSTAALMAAVEKACSIAKFTEEDPCSGLADADLMAKNLPDLDLYHPWQITAAQAIALALDCETSARAHDLRIKNSEGASVMTHQAYHVYANSHGFLGAVPTTRHSVACALVAEENGEMERDHGFTLSRDFKKLEDVKTIGALAAKRTVSRLGSRKLSTMKVPVILVSELARGLMGSFIYAIHGNNLYRKASFLLDYLDKPVFAKHVRLYEDPFLPSALGSSAFDREGVATQKKDLVSAGILNSYVLNSYAARKMGMQTTGNAGGVHNLFSSHSELDLKALLKKMDKGVLVTELIGDGVNIITGDYSRGAAGFWVENGEIQYPVSEITIAGNLKDMFLNLVAIGNDIDKNGSIQIGSILLEEMTVAGS